ncbi:AsmA-like C-terminal region-containing protein [Flavivirga amylovorans]|uniref:AsmA-like C-terminal region-containing protein n=1 Tax=Flavivirga amylovorans TaxID=870486 RepID=A0ABT8X3W1_9FLAO|nr:AsmA-like C-terminal region-containing protein [Flavivirga amylovorans]MDO5988388.1 AsmA-like C-terminal region-containing protein [Flavivirga amylovorans]
MKKALKILSITLLIILALLIAIPFAFKGQIKDMVKQSINDNLNAQVEFSDVSLSFLTSFPQAHVSVTDLVITNFKPFKDETFLTSKNIALTMSIKELFKMSGGDPIIVNSITVDETLLTLKTDKFGNTNYDIAKKDEENTSTEIETETSGFSFDIENYSINNSALAYIDEGSKMTVYISELNHEGKGIFSAETSELDTKSEANISFSIDSSTYLSNNPIKLDAIIGLDLANNKYTFKDNKALINKLPLEFHGYVQQLENGQEIDITFGNPETSFKNFLAVIPEEFSKNIEGVQTTGDFKVKGIVKGLSSEETIPTLDISLTSNNASFKYPDLPKRVKNITINTVIKNTTGHVDDTYVDIKALNFSIDEDMFKSSASLKNIAKNMSVNASIDGSLNLANVTKVYPVELENTLTGTLKATINTAFDMNAIETNTYERIKNNGSASISDFVFSSEDIVNPIHIFEANMSFNPGTVSLNSFKARTGNSDINASGTIKSLLGFLLSDNTLQGYFNVNSTFFKVSDFMSEDETASTNNKTTSDSESLKIPAFLDCTINANAKTVLYDNLNLKDLKGTLIIKDQRATLKDMTSNLFDGALAISGDVSTKNETPTFNLNLGVDGFDISQSFKELELLRSLAPVAKILQGKLNTNINLAGHLDSEFSPELSSVSGDALAELLTTKINENKGELFNQLEGSLSFIDFDKLDLKALKTTLEFADGKVSVKPFQLKYDDITIDVSGSHGFDKKLEYSAVFNVPAKYLGSDVNQLIGKINDEDAKNITIPVTANIGGTYTKPSVKTDLTSGVKNLTKQLIEIEKQKALNKGKDKVKDLISGVIGGNKSKTDSIKKEQSSSVEKVLGDIIKSKKTPKDSTKTDATKDAVKNALGGLLGGRKKKG